MFLGLVNLLPLLPFDGGHIAIATVREDRLDRHAAQGAGRRGQAHADHGRGAGVLVFIFVSSLFLDITHPVGEPVLTPVGPERGTW